MLRSGDQCTLHKSQTTRRLCDIVRLDANDDDKHSACLDGDSFASVPSKNQDEWFIGDDSEDDRTNFVLPFSNTGPIDTVQTGTLLQQAFKEGDYDESFNNDVTAWTYPTYTNVSPKASRTIPVPIPVRPSFKSGQKNTSKCYTFKRPDFMPASKHIQSHNTDPHSNTVWIQPETIKSAYYNGRWENGTDDELFQMD
ncbi:hypothetical protein ABG067_000586 [Albugo candida]|uniref:Uncharacterized protein n=1 Tax=Albugo candida TaxID=65357 RepID=A0A024GIR1_9STRA|nr:unnamed protein product [Albugo candida]|eukprot:CCI46387.1 unnamed protein product [Albugo candida]